MILWINVGDIIWLVIVMFEFNFLIILFIFWWLLWIVNNDFFFFILFLIFLFKIILIVKLILFFFVKCFVFNIIEVIFILLEINLVI